jgi:hypothetical protein
MIYIYAGIAIALVILILLLPYLSKAFNKDQFAPIKSRFGYPVDDYYDPSYDTHTNFAFWNTQRGTKRGMSYDLRGDVPIGQRRVFPFNMSSTSPIVNKPLWMVS